jgi:hypothetical protein
VPETAPDRISAGAESTAPSIEDPFPREVGLLLRRVGSGHGRDGWSWRGADVTTARSAEGRSEQTGTIAGLYRGDGRESLGRSLSRRSAQPLVCSDAVVVLRWDGRSGFIVLTSYPESRR